MAMSREKKRMIRLGVLAFLLLFIISTSIFLVVLNSKNNKLEKQLEQLEKQLEATQEKDELTLISVGKTMVPDMTNGITKANLSNFTVNTSYPIVVYQVIGKDDKVLLNDFHEYDGSAKYNYFILQNLSEELTEIRLVGCDKEGNYVEAQTYKFIYLD